MSSPDAPRIFSGSKLYTARRALPISRAKFGKLLKRTPQTIWLWERNKVSPSAKMVGQIAFHLGKSINFFYEDGEAFVAKDAECPE